jgi:hypothetical protein
MGLEVGGFYRWNSGTLANPSSRLYGHHVPIRSAPYEFAGMTKRWIAPDAVGSLTNPMGFRGSDATRRRRSPISWVGLRQAEWRATRSNRAVEVSTDDDTYLARLRMLR